MILRALMLCANCNAVLSWWPFHPCRPVWRRSSRRGRGRGGCSGCWTSCRRCGGTSDNTTCLHLNYVQCVSCIASEYYSTSVVNVAADHRVSTPSRAWDRIPTLPFSVATDHVNPCSSQTTLATVATVTDPDFCDPVSHGKPKSCPSTAATGMPVVLITCVDSYAIGQKPFQLCGLVALTVHFWCKAHEKIVRVFWLAVGSRNMGELSRSTVPQ